jgi:hypothetical protein
LGFERGASCDVRRRQTSTGLKHPRKPNWLCGDIDDYEVDFIEEMAKQKKIAS